MRRVPMREILEDEELVARHKGEPFTGVAFETGEQDAVASELTFVDGQQHGPARDWYPNGQLKAVTSYRGGLQHGREEEWYSDGSRKAEAVYEYGIVLEKRAWSENGTKMKDYVLGSEDPLRETLRLARGARQEETD